MTIEEYNNQYAFFQDITGKAMQVHSEYHGGLLESAYEAALTYLLTQDSYHVDRQVFLPIYWKEVKLDQNYRMDLVVNHQIIIELKAMTFTGLEHRKQLWNYMNLTHMPYGMLINFSPKGLYSEWYHRHENGEMEQIRVRKNDL